MSTQPIEANEILSTIRERALAAFSLENAGDEPVEAQVSGHFYVLQPGQPIHVADRLDWKRGKKGLLLTNEPRFVPPGGDAATIAAEILSESRLGTRGVFIRYGDGHDDERRRLSRAQYISWRVQRARVRQGDWINKVEKIMRQPGALPPVQSQTLREDLAFLARYEAGLIDRKKFICRIDGAESDDRQVIVDHVRTHYAQQLANAGGVVDGFILDRDQVKPPSAPEAAAEVSALRQPVEQVAPPAPPVPSTLPETDIAFLVDKADELGVNLTKETLRGLLRGEADTIRVVTELLAATAAKKATGNKKEGANGHRA
jgi:hypothetical protein